MSGLASLLYLLFKVPAPVSKETQECVCGGECLCHGTGGLCAVECPFGSSSCVSGFDICHRCVCLNPKYRRQAA